MMKSRNKHQRCVMVSACLLGINCRYDGKNACNKQVASMVDSVRIIFACPEQLGGLTTPRSKNRIVGDRVVNEKGIDVTGNFYRGAREFINIAKKFGVRKFLLKNRSPSCGKQGILTKILPKNIEVEYKR
ncbi:MAG: DUF523 domain-containing protein [bacterium]